jgi:hypothetical protein
MGGHEPVLNIGVVFINILDQDPELLALQGNPLLLLCPFVFVSLWRLGLLKVFQVPPQIFEISNGN